jgi:hypothetical protein
MSPIVLAIVLWLSEPQYNNRLFRSCSVQRKLSILEFSVVIMNGDIS